MISILAHVYPCGNNGQDVIKGIYKVGNHLWHVILRFAHNDMR